jgi:hypothetical protein
VNFIIDAVSGLVSTNCWGRKSLLLSTTIPTRYLLTARLGKVPSSPNSRLVIKVNSFKSTLVKHTVPDPKAVMYSFNSR